MLLWASSALGPGHACALSWLAHLAALACVHLLMHTAVLAAGCRACARVGASTALVGGLVAICGYCLRVGAGSPSDHHVKPLALCSKPYPFCRYYLVLTRLLQRVMGIEKVGRVSGVECQCLFASWGPGQGDLEFIPIALLFLQYFALQTAQLLPSSPVPPPVFLEFSCPTI